MKGLFTAVLLSLFINLHSPSRTQMLPEEIQQYYQDMNFLNLYSQPEERNNICNAFMTGYKVDSFSSPRIKEMSSLLISTWYKFYHPVVRDNRVCSPIPEEFFDLNYYFIVKWKKDENHITVVVNSYAPDPDYITKNIKSYTSELTPENHPALDIKQAYIYHNSLIHEWQLKDGHWIKENPLVKLLN